MKPRWNIAIQVIHWLMAIAIIAMCVLGWWMQSLPASPNKFSWYALHKSVGITLLALVIVRLILRGISQRPKLPAMPLWQKRLSGFSHACLYVLMFVMPISGYLHSAWANAPIKWFGLFEIPALVGADSARKVLAENTHLIGFWLLAAFAMLHIAAALWHHFKLGDAVLSSMLPRSWRT